MNIINEIANNLKNARKNANLTQADAAARLGITYQAISNYERGVTRVDSDTLMKLCALYDVAVSEILGETQPASTSSNTLKDAAPSISPEDLELLELFHAAPPEKQAAIRALLK